MNATLTITGTIDEIIALAAVLKVGREIAGLANAPPPVPPYGTLNQFEAHEASKGRFIEAIKLVRTRLNLGLKEAKDYVEASAEYKAWKAGAVPANWPANP